MIAALALAASASLAILSPEERRFLGAWRLVETRETLADGTSRPNARYGPHGRGYLIYDAAHVMCAFLDNPTRPFPPPPGADAHTPEAWPAAYCGQWSVDTARQEISHVVDLDVVPSAKGDRRVRAYRFEGDRLIYRPVPLRPGQQDYVLVFERLR